MDTSDPSFTARPDTIPQWIIEVTRLVRQAALAQEIEFVIVGATARDIVLQSVFGLAPGRRTIDLDFGFAVETWEQFAALKSALVATGHFQSVNRVSQRLLYQGRSPVDLIPFGGVEEDGEIAWPPSCDEVLNVSGFKDALASAVSVQLETDLVVPIVSPETRVRIISILESDEQLERLLSQMLQTTIGVDERVPKQCEEFLGAFRQAFLKD